MDTDDEGGGEPRLARTPPPHPPETSGGGRRIANANFAVRKKSAGAISVFRSGRRAAARGRGVAGWRGGRGGGSPFAGVVRKKQSK